jgi:hypothetical protein
LIESRPRPGRETSLLAGEPVAGVAVTHEMLGQGAEQGGRERFVTGRVNGSSSAWEPGSLIVDYDRSGRVRRAFASSSFVD